MKKLIYFLFFIFFINITYSQTKIKFENDLDSLDVKLIGTVLNNISSDKKIIKETYLEFNLKDEFKDMDLEKLFSSLGYKINIEEKNELFDFELIDDTLLEELTEF